jgi:PPOX class probable F420-dependent enzyme
MTPEPTCVVAYMSEDTTQNNTNPTTSPTGGELALPESHIDLLERPLFAHLATVRPDGAPQSSVMWFVWDGARLRITHTKSRQKFANLAQDPRLSLSIADPEDGYRTIEVRGVVESVEDDDETASFYKALQHRYGMDYEIHDAPVRVVMTIRPTKVIATEGGGIVATAGR